MGPDVSSGSSHTGPRPEEIFEPSAGAVLNDRYVLDSSLEKGAAGLVWRGRHLGLGKRVAIKILKAEHARDEDDWAVKRMLREARLLSEIEHPAVVDVLDHGEHGGCPYIVMELLEGRTLARALRDEGAISWQRAALLIEQLVEGLDAAHRAGVIHRDLKPANIILLDGDTRAKLIDFGIAGARGRTRITMDGEVLGTPHFMSPEQSWTMDLTATSDIYSFGCVVFSMLAGRPPYVGKIGEIVRQHLEGPVPVVSQLVGPDVPRDVCVAIQRCMAKDPNKRFQSMSAVYDAMLGRPMGTAGGMITGRTRARTRSRQRGVVTALATGGTFAVALMVTAVVVWTQPDDTARSDAPEPRPASVVAPTPIDAASQAPGEPASSPDPEPAEPTADVATPEPKALPVEFAKPKQVEAAPAASARPRRRRRSTSKPAFKAWSEVSQPTPTQPRAVEKVGELKNPFDFE